MAQSIEFQLGEEIIELKARNAKLVAALEEADREISAYTGSGAISRVRQIIHEALANHRRQPDVDIGL